jgi:NADPH-dependent F420 reductase
VALGSREAERAEASAAQLVEHLAPTAELRDRLTGASNADASAGHDVVVLATPWDALGDSLRDLSHPLADAVVISATNPLGFDALGPFALDVREGSAAEQVAALLPASRVAPAFHHLSPPSHLNLEHDLGHEDVLICANDD